MRATLSSFLIRPCLLRPGWLLLYAATFAIQIFCAQARGLIAYVALWLVFLLFGVAVGAHERARGRDRLRAACCSPC